MKINSNLLMFLQSEFNRMGISYAELGRRGKTNYQNFQRVLHAQVSEVTQETVDAICMAFDVTQEELFKISKGESADGGAVNEFADPYKADVWDELAAWLRRPGTSAKVKSAVLHTAELGGFDSPRLENALNVLSTASSPGCDDREHCEKVA